MTTTVRHTTRDVAARLGGAAIGFALIVIAGMVMTHSTAWTSAEMNILKGFSRLHTPALDAFALGINWLFSPPLAATIVAVVTAVILLRSRSVRTAVQFAVIVTGSWLGSEVIKLLVQRPRPDGSLLAHQLITESSFGFPSGHTAFAASLAFGLIVLAQGKSWRPAVVTAGIIAAVLVALSRVYLGVHYVSDVTASLLYSAVAVSILALLWNRYAAPRFQ